MTKLPSPEQWALVRMTADELAEEIERHIDFVDEQGRSVHLPMPFVRHYLQRRDGELPTVVAIATAPIVLADGGILAKEQDNDLDVERGIEFHIPTQLMALLPRQENCPPAAVKKAMKYLVDEWLCDVKTDYSGKCIMIAAALTVIERSLLPDRPVFFVSAGRRGSGKTTTLTMLIMAVAGLRPAAAAWSSNEEERRKALLSYFLHGVSYIIWDNIPRGSTISCSHIEKSCTAAYYSDRKLCVSEMVATAASTIHFFTGNNISSRADLASRSLHVRLQADRADPENRKFKHPDAVQWTEDYRAEIMEALYIILLGNPKPKEPRDAPIHTRFKMWWRLVGSAVENAATLHGHRLDFRTLFRAVEAEDEDDVSLVEVLTAKNDMWPNKLFKAKEVADIINAFDHKYQSLLRSYLCPTLTDRQNASPVTIGKKLGRHVDEPVFSDGRTLVLKKEKNTTEGAKSALNFKVVITERKKKTLRKGRGARSISRS